MDGKRLSRTEQRSFNFSLTRDEASKRETVPRKNIKMTMTRLECQIGKLFDRGGLASSRDQKSSKRLNTEVKRK